MTSAAVLASLATGCAGPGLSTVEVTHFGADGSTQLARQSFAHAYYRRGPAGQLRVALCTRAPSQADPFQTISQIILLDMCWQPRPGRTLAEQTMTDATIKYALLSGPHATSYEGAGFVSFTEDSRSGELRGRIESGHLARRRTRGNPVDVFGGQARLTGEFIARRSAIEVANLQREVNLALGPPTMSPGPGFLPPRPRERG